MNENEHPERIAVLETKVEAIQEALLEIKASLEEFKPIIWKSVGALGLLVILMNVIFGIKVH
jgi:hypothetical protein